MTAATATRPASPQGSGLSFDDAWATEAYAALRHAAGDRHGSSCLPGALGDLGAIAADPGTGPDEMVARLYRIAPGADETVVEALAEYAVLAAREEAGWQTGGTSAPLPIEDLISSTEQFGWDLTESGYEHEAVEQAGALVASLLADNAAAAEAILDAADALEAAGDDSSEIVVGPDGAPLLIRWGPDGGLVLDCFAGPGGWSEGLLREHGIRDLGVEWDEWACRTRAAAGHATVRADVSALPLGRMQGKVWGLCSSPPCPDWSPAGKRAGLDGASGWLTGQVLAYAEALRPAWVAAEQVPTAPVLALFGEYATRLRSMGYRARVLVVNAADYGVPQVRRRAVLLAHRRDFAAPAPTHAKNGPTLDGLPPWQTMAEALGWGFTRRPALTVTSQRSGSGLRFEGGSGARRTFAREQLSGGWKPRLIGGGFVHEADRAAAQGSGRMGKPTPGELGVLQGFRLDYPWQAPPATSGQPGHWKAYQQIGNAVPPPLAGAAVRPLLEA